LIDVERAKTLADEPPVPPEACHFSADRLLQGYDFISNGGWIGGIIYAAPPSSRYNYSVCGKNVY
jgi:hypothetical protein